MYNYVYFPLYKGNSDFSTCKNALNSAFLPCMENKKHSAKSLTSGRNLYSLESKNLLADYRASLAMAVGKEDGNPDIATAMNEIKASNERIRKAFKSRLLTCHKEPSKPSKADYPERNLLEFKRDTIAKNEFTLESAKNRKLKIEHGIPLAGETIASARLGVKEKDVRIHVEKDSLTRDKLASASSPCLAIIAATVIRTINFPKGYVKQEGILAERGDFILAGKQASKAQVKSSLAGKARRKLSPLEECEVFQTVALVLIGNDALHLEIDGGERWRDKNFGLWGKIYSACRESLGIEKLSWQEISLPDHHPIIALAESIETGYDAETVARARIRLAERVTESEIALEFYLKNSSDAKRKANHKNSLATLHAMARGEFTWSLPSKQEIEKRSKARSKMESCLAYGLRFILAEREEQEKRALEIEIAIAMHGHLCASCV